MLGYLRFIDSLNEWLFTQTGRDLTFDLPHLLGTKNFEDWQVCARRWHEINGKLKRRAPEGEAAADQPIHLGWPALLTRVESVGDVTFNSLDSYEDLAAEAETMRNCASTYVASCTVGEAHMIHMARGGVPVGTVEVRHEMADDNVKITLVHAEAAGQQPLTVEAEQALHQFLNACNDGTVEMNPDAVLPRSVRMELLAPMLKLQPIDFPTWDRAFFNLGSHYFDIHARVTGTDLIEKYRAALELKIDAKDSLYQLALRAVKQCHRSISNHGNIRYVR
jgi:hypothetical protein